MNKGNYRISDDFGKHLAMRSNLFTPPVFIFITNLDDEDMVKFETQADAESFIKNHDIKEITKFNKETKQIRWVKYE